MRYGSCRWWYGRRQSTWRHFQARPVLEELENRLAPAALAAMSIVRTTPVGPITNQASVVYTVTFNQPVTGVAASDFKVSTDGSTQAATPMVVGGASGSSSYTVTVNGIHGNGDLRLDLIGNGTIVGSGGALGTSGSFQGQTYTILQTYPNVESISRTTPAGSATSASSVTYTVTFNKAVTGVVPSDFQVATTGTVTGSVTQVVPSSAAVYMVTVGGITGSGTLGLNLVDNGAVRDLAGNRLVPASSLPAFHAQPAVAAGSKPYAVAVGDVNGDGKPDLVIANGGSNTVSVVLGNGDGTFGPPHSYDTGLNPDAVALADVNGDGKLDLVVTNLLSNTVSVLLGNGDGTFGVQHTFPTGRHPWALAVADLNGDGKPDLIVVNQLDNNVSVLLGNGDGTFGPQHTFKTGSNPLAVAVGDVNADGKPDLLVANEYYSTVSVLLGNGDGTFGAKHNFAAGPDPSSIALGDLNGDGKPDLVFGSLGVNSVSVDLGNGDGTFQAPVPYATGTGPYAVALADVNGDGKPDVVTANYGSNTVSVLLGNGDGTLQPQQSFPSGAQPVAVAVADLNGDGLPDLLVTNHGDGTVSVLMNSLSGSFTGQVYNIVQPVLALSVPPSSLAGRGFVVTVEAKDSSGNPIAGYNATATITTTDPQVPTLPPVTITNGVGFFLATLKTAPGPWTITAAVGTIATTSIPISVTPAAPVRLGFGVQPASSATGNAISPAVTVQVQDLYGNVVTSDNTDSVIVSVASGPGSFLAGSTTTAPVHNGVASFTNLTLVQPGRYTLGAIVPLRYAGPNSAAFSVVPLQVVPGSFAGSPSGFSLSFNAPFLVNATTPVLYGQGFGAAGTIPAVTLTQTRDGSGNPVDNPVEGSLIPDSPTSITYLATNTVSMVTNGTPLLPDGTYRVDLAGSAAANGFQALNPGGGLLDGLGTGTPGSGDYVVTFTVGAAAAHDDVLWVPPTADGPGQALNAPGNNQVGGGYPIYLNDSTGAVTKVLVTLNYNPALLTVTGVTGAHFTLLSTSTPGQAVLQYSGPALPMGSQTPIGFVTAAVPSGTTSNPIPYRSKDLLHLSNVSLNGGAIPVATSDGLHLVAYVGDADGNGVYSSNDAVVITRVSLQTDTGFPAYPMVDPVIVADTDGAGFIPADAALQVNEAGIGVLTANLANPPIPPNVHFQIMSTSAIDRVFAQAAASPWLTQADLRRIRRE